MKKEQYYKQGEGIKIVYFKNMKYGKMSLNLEGTVQVWKSSEKCHSLINLSSSVH